MHHPVEMDVVNETGLAIEQGCVLSPEQGSLLPTHARNTSSQHSAISAAATLRR
jgi:hypothetical protein